MGNKCSSILSCYPKRNYSISTPGGIGWHEDELINLNGSTIIQHYKHHLVEPASPTILQRRRSLLRSLEEESKEEIKTDKKSIL